MNQEKSSGLDSGVTVRDLILWVFRWSGMLELTSEVKAKVKAKILLALSLEVLLALPSEVLLEIADAVFYGVVEVDDQGQGLAVGGAGAGDRALARVCCAEIGEDDRALDASFRCVG